MGLVRKHRAIYLHATYIFVVSSVSGQQNNGGTEKHRCTTGRSRAIPQVRSPVNSVSLMLAAGQALSVCPEALSKANLSVVQFLQIRPARLQFLKSSSRSSSAGQMAQSGRSSAGVLSAQIPSVKDCQALVSACQFVNSL
ncbi:hypothetical protein BCR37DRAFT_375950 [Protomyces lactucae-debilis]|uniref:Uncharacterized protein n=1 Tax=Protomyces lactucae-debilis TaxID=2754530 RepID=A0A1Y2FVE5_PROLT|nr:uncharacterized protein BCR37DRAFT_375950 [Protomyces lactucae-debilis]ORY87971.1 hypothetical protein BCR37DRAFT_375950 [Protomyces lactucae-debilis]